MFLSYKNKKHDTKPWEIQPTVQPQEKKVFPKTPRLNVIGITAVYTIFLVELSPVLTWMSVVVVVPSTKNKFI